MATLHEQYRSLVSLTALHLLREVEPDRWVLTNPETHSFYRQYAASKPRPKPAPRPMQPMPPPASVTEPPKPIIPMKPPPPRQQPPPTSIPADDLHDVRATITKVCPHLSTLDTVPDDAKARQMNTTDRKPNKKKTEVLVLATTQGPIAHQDFLQKVTTAIDERLRSAKMITIADLNRPKAIERLLSASHIRLILTTTTALRTHEELYRHYQESVQEGRGFIGKIPVLRVDPIHDYLQNPKRKAALWQQLQALLK